MNIIKTSAPTDDQRRDLAALAGCCRTHDNIRLSYPSDDCKADCRHYLLYEDNGTLTAALALLLLDDGLAECSAFTHPAYRRRGYFTRLLDDAVAMHDECDILFAVSESCADTMAVLTALGAEPESREYQMELDFSQGGRIGFPGERSDDFRSEEAWCSDTGFWDIRCSDTNPGSPTRRDAFENTWTLYKHGALVGQCLISSVSDACVCLHHFEISAPLRGKGYGSRFLRLLLPRLEDSGVCKVILQVSGDNPAAIALYKKTGFRLTETLSYYCY